MMIEIVSRDPQNKRIRKMNKINISEKIQAECKECVELVLFQQAEQISQLFEIIDTKHTYGILSELSSAVLGIEEFLELDEKKRFSSQYHRCIDRLNYCLVNLSTQLIYSLEFLDDRLLDQIFIRKTILLILEMYNKYINTADNNILSSQKEFLGGLVIRLIYIYNNRLQNAISRCEQEDNWWSKSLIFANSMNSGCSIPQAFANVLINTNNQTQYKQYLINNLLNFNITEIEIETRDGG